MGSTVKHPPLVAVLMWWLLHPRDGIFAGTEFDPRRRRGGVVTAVGGRARARLAGSGLPLFRPRGWAGTVAFGGRIASIRGATAIAVACRRIGNRGPSKMVATVAGIRSERAHEELRAALAHRVLPRAPEQLNAWMPTSVRIDGRDVDAWWVSAGEREALYARIGVIVLVIIGGLGAAELELVAM